MKIANEGRNRSSCVGHSPIGFMSGRPPRDGAVRAAEQLITHTERNVRIVSSVVAAAWPSHHGLRCNELSHLITDSRHE